MARDRIDKLPDRLNLKMVHALEAPPPDWTADTGYLNAEILTRHLPAGFQRFQYFACGPNAMLDAVETAMRHIYMTRIAIATSVLLVLAGARLSRFRCHPDLTQHASPGKLADE